MRVFSGSKYRSGAAPKQLPYMDYMNYEHASQGEACRCGTAAHRVRRTVDGTASRRHYRRNPRSGVVSVRLHNEPFFKRVTEWLARNFQLLNYR